jgi:hypothetical protein
VTIGNKGKDKEKTRDTKCAVDECGSWDSRRIERLQEAAEAARLRSRTRSGKEVERTYLCNKAKRPKAIEDEDHFYDYGVLTISDYATPRLKPVASILKPVPRLLRSLIRCRSIPPQQLHQHSLALWLLLLLPKPHQCRMETLLNCRSRPGSV